MNSTDEVQLGPVTAETVAMSLPMILVSILGIVGNTMVWLAIYRDKSLRSVSNMYVANLSLADFLVCVTCAPLSSFASLHGGQWAISKGLCQFWGIMNCVFCIASLLTLFAYSIYRYYAVTRVQHSTKLPKIAAGSIVLVWILSILFTIPPLVGWGDMKFYPSHCVCTVDWVADQSYSVFVIAAAFGAPLAVMMVTYYKMFRFIHSQNITVGAAPKLKNPANGGGECSKASETNVTDAGKDAPLELKSGIGAQNADKNTINAEEIVPVVKKPMKSVTPNKINVQSNVASEVEKNKLAQRTSRERKLIKILVTTVAVYLLCWSPWSVDSLVVTFGGSGERPFPLERIELWLAYVAVIKNPITLDPRYRSSLRCQKQ